MKVSCTSYTQRAACLLFCVVFFVSGPGLIVAATESSNGSLESNPIAEPVMSAVAPASRSSPPTGWSTELGAAVIANPEFQGSNTYNVLPVPYFDFRYTDELGLKHFANVPQGLGTYFYRAQGAGGVRRAASIALAPGFANRDPDDFDGLDTFGPGVEARLGMEIGSRRWGVSATVAKALGTGHEGLYLDLSASWRRRVGQRGFL
ncbi:MAG: MipA/OmpV family protein, partial [Pseudomonadota bacterium]